MSGEVTLYLEVIKYQFQPYHLYEDLKDGSRLLMLIELLTGEKLVPNNGQSLYCIYTWYG